ncbi:MAG: prephenate dehydrogenase/arogenate dehydrogenase family protein [Acidimicrobiales bacterium]
MKRAPSNAAVVGLGLIGCSIGLALRAQGWVVTGTDTDPGRAARALELGAVDSIELDRRAAIAFVAVPASSVVAVADRLLSGDETGALVVTDVASVKLPIANALSHPRFVPGHPMAGSEQDGPDGADRDLFAGATWVLTPTGETDEAGFSVVRDVVTSLGADVVALPPDRHDDLVAIVSHVPHLTSATLMSLAAESQVDRGALMRLAASGFRDMTRIAAGSPSIWPDICSENSGAIVPVLDRLIERLGEIRRIVAESDRAGLMSMLEGARSARRNLPSRGERPRATVELRVLVPDRPGVLAEVTAMASRMSANIYDIEIAHSTEGPRGVLVLVVDEALGGPLVAELRSSAFKVSVAGASS